MTAPGPAAAGSLRFLLLYALAWAGGSIAYVPFLTILLPVRVAGLAGGGQAVSWLAYIAFAGAVAASLGNIAFGFLSDVTRNRRGWVAAGLLGSGVLLVLVTRATRLAELVALVVAWQLALNMMLAPLAAWAGDRVPDRQKGLLGGLMAFAPGLGALAGAAVTVPGLATFAQRLPLVALAVALCVGPLLLLAGPETAGEPQPPPAAAAPQPEFHSRRAVVRMWLARLSLQVAEAALFSYLYLWFHALDPAMDDSRTARTFSLVLVLSAPLAVVVGRRADRLDRPISPLIACALVTGAGLLGMAASPGVAAAIASYAVFGLASSVFLALHSAQTLRVLPRPGRRGRDLGLFNLTNTVPSLVMPWLTLALVPVFGFSGLFVLLALLALLSAGLLASIATRPA